MLIAIVGATIGKVGVFNKTYSANINQAICAVRFNSNINPFYAHFILLTKFGQIQLDRIKRPVARANINLDEISTLILPVIDIDQQNEIVRLFAESIKSKTNN